MRCSKYSKAAGTIRAAMAFALLCGSAVADTQEDLSVLGGQWRGEPSSTVMARYLQGLTDEALDRRAETFETLLTTPEQIEEYQKRLRAFLDDRLGPWPERTPLNARTVARREFDDYRVENVIFESRPNFHVTATLRLPKTDPPYPAVLVACGHSATAKAYELYQRGSILLAKKGIASLCWDPIGQGERFQILATDGKPTMGGTREHTLVGQGAILVGSNAANYFVWDGIRAIDYLVSREDIDAGRIGCAGNSGGGTQTTYLMAVDDRIRAAAPSCFLTSLQRLLTTASPQDAEQNLFGAIAFGMEHADYIHVRAPSPTLILSRTEDFFDIKGTWDTFREAKRLFTVLGLPECVGLAEAPGPHGWHQLLREATVQWMQRWLLGVDAPVSEPDFPVMEAQELWSTPGGQVLLLEGERSAFDLNAELQQRLGPQRRAFWRERVRQDVQAKIAEVAGIGALHDLPDPELTVKGHIERDGYRIDKVVLTREEKVPLPALVFVPAQRTGDVYLYAHGEGKHVDAGAGGPIERLVRQGHTVWAVDLRGMGETLGRENNKGWTAQFGPDWTDIFRAYLLGRSYVGMRAEDLIVLGRFLATHDAGGTLNRVHLVAIGEASVPAMHATAVWERLFATVRLERYPHSWVPVVSSTRSRRQLSNVVQGALEYYDLPDLRSLVPEERLILVDPVDERWQVIEADVKE